MSISARSVSPMKILAFIVAGALLALPAQAQTPPKDGIGELLREAAPTAPPAAEPADPREGDPSYEQARALMRAIDGVLADVAEQRAEAKKLPAKDEFLSLIHI